MADRNTREGLELFLKSLCGDIGFVEFNNLDRTFSLDSILLIEEDGYFVGSTNNTKIRASKENIIARNYFYIDFDVRKDIKEKTGEVIDDFDLINKLEEIKEGLSKHKYLSQRRYCVFTGNGYHFYYTGKCADLSKYEDAVLSLFEDCDSIFQGKYITDKTVRTLARIARLPMTKNYARKRKYGLDLMSCQIESSFDRDCDAIPIFKEIADNYNDKKEKEYYQRVFEEKRKSILQNNPERFDEMKEINKISIGDIVSQYAGLELKQDGINFKSNKDGKNVGMYVDKELNLVRNFGTSYISDNAKSAHNTNSSRYNPFSFIKEHYNLDDKGTFERFSKNYSYIDEIRRKSQEEYKKRNMKSEVITNIENPDEYLLSFGNLLDRATKYRQSLDSKKICNYGISAIDDFLCGILPDELVVIGAGPGVGKSEIAYNISTSNAMNGKKVLLFSLEGNIEEIALRYLQNRVNKIKKIRTVDYRFNLLNINEIENKVKSDVAQSVKNNLLIFDKTQIPSLVFIRTMIESKAKEIDIIIIDHLHYIFFETDSEAKEIGKIMRELKTLTDIIKKPVVLISHVRKKDQRLESKDITMSDLHGSSNIPKEATTILLINKCSLNGTKTLGGVCEQDQYRYSGTKVSVPKSRIGLPPLDLIGAYDRRNKEYVECEWQLADDSVARDDDKISFKI